jgi:hypothetical protein
VAGETENIPFLEDSQAVPARPSGKDGINWRQGKALGSETYGVHEYRLKEIQFLPHRKGVRGRVVGSGTAIQAGSIPAEIIGFFF